MYYSSENSILYSLPPALRGGIKGGAIRAVFMLRGVDKGSMIIPAKAGEYPPNPVWTKMAEIEYASARRIVKV